MLDKAIIERVVIDYKVGLINWIMIIIIVSLLPLYELNLDFLDLSLFHVS